MNRLAILAVLIICVSIVFGQTQTERIRTFGSSLDKYKKKSRENSESKPPVESGEVIQINTDLVVSHVLVTDKSGTVITGLQKEDFIVTEDGVRQTIESFSFGEAHSAPRSIVLVIDIGVTQLPYLKNSIRAAKMLIQKLRPCDKMAIVTDNLKLLSYFTDNKTELEKSLDTIEVKYAALMIGFEFTNLLAVLNELFAEHDRNRIIILQGSGNGIFLIKQDDESVQESYTAALRTRGVNMEPIKVAAFNDIDEAIQSSQATIYSIIPGPKALGFSEQERLARAGRSIEAILDETYRLRGRPRLSSPIPFYLRRLEAHRLVYVQTAMAKVAELSGGTANFLESPADAEKIYSNVLNDFSNRYSIGYYPADDDGQGSRNVEITVRDHPEYTVRTRKSYIRSEK